MSEQWSPWELVQSTARLCVKSVGGMNASIGSGHAGSGSSLWPMLLLATVMLSLAGCSQFTPRPASYNDELECLKTVNAARPAEDPLLAYLLMLEFRNSNRLAEGVAFYEALLQKHDASLSKTQRARYLSNLGILRALHAEDIP